MPLTGAQKQVRYRGRHLVNGTKAALHLFVSASARAKIIRLAHHRGCTMTALVEELATRAEQGLIWATQQQLLWKQPVDQSPVMPNLRSSGYMPRPARNSSPPKRLAKAYASSGLQKAEHNEVGAGST